MNTQVPATKIHPLDQLRQSHGASDLTDDEKRTLTTFALQAARQNKNPGYLEIGIFGGGTIHYVRHLVPQMQCVGVDMFEDFQVDMTSNTHNSGNYRMEDVQQFLGPAVTLHKGDSAQVIPSLHGQFDLIFIDGNHTYDGCKADYENSRKLLAPKGFIAFHNASPHMGPDWDIYSKRDGGPFLFAMELKLGNEMVCVAEVDRVTVFTPRRHVP
jgi:predicted O-methyltransferase YrrM